MFMTLKKSLFDIFVKVVKFILNLNRPTLFSCAFNESIDLIYVAKTSFSKIKLACPNRLNFWRAQSFLTKEPDMIEWINTFDSSCTLLDVGANIGLYSIYAAKRGAGKVIAIEPESQNYAILNKNIYLNNLSDKIIALNIGFSDENCISVLYIPKFEAGMALNNLGDNTDWKKQRFTPDFKQAVVSYTIDSFLDNHPDLFPTHLKIDVDGIERKIIDGAGNLLKDSRLRQIMIELNDALSEDMEILKIFKESGFLLKSKYHSPIVATDYQHVSNYLFSREGAQFKAHY